MERRGSHESPPGADELCTAGRRGGERICFPQGCFNVLHTHNYMGSANGTL